MLSNEVIRQISGGQGGTYIFDFSRISQDKYESLFRTLQHFAQSKIDNLGFNCDELVKSQAKSLSGVSMPPIVLGSIAKNKSHYIQNLVQLLCYIIPRSSRIKALELATMNFKPDQINRLSTSFGKSSSLLSLSFCQIPLGNQGLISILNALNPNQIQSISIKYCGITGDATGAILQFISKKTDPKGISNFSISKTELSQEDRDAIERALQNSQPKSDFLSNQSKSKFLQSATENTTKVTNKDNSEKITQQKAKTTKLQKGNSPNKSPNKKTQQQKDEEELKALKEENEALQLELSQLQQSLDIVQFSQDVFLVGKGAKDFIQFLNDVETKIQQYDKQNDTNMF